MDVIHDLAYPLPVIVIAELLGIPREDRVRFKHWSDQVVGAVPAEGKDPQIEMSEYFVEMIEQRRIEPRNDLISALRSAQIEGQHLSVEELLGFCILLLVAGNETTTHLISSGFLCFYEYPETMEQLRADPELIPGAVEEVLRYRSPVKLVFRALTSDTKVGDQKISCW